jgi:hypothetical protein
MAASEVEGTTAAQHWGEVGGSVERGAALGSSKGVECMDYILCS